MSIRTWVRGILFGPEPFLPQFEDDTRCTLAPNGWFCTIHAGHEGPCAAWPGRFEDYR